MGIGLSNPRNVPRQEEKRDTSRYLDFFQSKFARWDFLDSTSVLVSYNRKKTIMNFRATFY